MGDVYQKVKVAGVHAASVFLDREGSTRKACDIIAEAGKEGAKLVVFPETFIPGYPFWIWTHTPTTGAPFFVELFKNAVEIPSATTDQIGEAARKAGAYVVMGINERDGGTLYNTLLYFNDQGEIIGKHRKLQPTHVERTIWGRGDGSDLGVYETPFGKVSGLICWEHSMDLVRYSLACQGEQIHIASWPAISALSHNPHSALFDSWSEAASKHHAAAAQSFVINVQSCIDQDTIDKLGFTNQPDMMRTGGGWSAILDPSGQIIAGPHRDEEKILYAELNLEEIILAKYATDSIGHYARPDVVRLAMNTSRHSVIEFSNNTAPVSTTNSSLEQENSDNHRNKVDFNREVDRKTSEEVVNEKVTN